MTRRARAVAFVIAGAAASCAPGEPARLVATPLPVESRGVETRAAFELRNVGGRPLLLDRVVPACGCGPTSRLPAELAPGAAARLEVACRGARVAGDDVREILLRTSDPRSPETLLRVVLAPGAATLPPAYLGYVPVGETLVREVALGAARGNVAPIGGELAAEPATSVDGTGVVRLRFAPRAAGVLRTTLDLGTAGFLPVTAVAYDRVLAFPAEIRVPRSSGTSGLPAITLVAAGEAPLALARVEYPAGMSGDLRAVVPGKEYRLVLRGAPTTADPSVRIHGAGGGDPLLVIPVVDVTRAGPPA